MPNAKYECTSQLFFASHVEVCINSQYRATLNFYLPYYHANMDQRPKCNPCYATFASRLAQNSPNCAKYARNWQHPYLWHGDEINNV